MKALCRTLIFAAAVGTASSYAFAQQGGEDGGFVPVPPQQGAAPPPGEAAQPSNVPDAAGGLGAPASVDAAGRSGLAPAQGGAVPTNDPLSQTQPPQTPPQPGVAPPVAGPPAAPPGFPLTDVEQQSVMQVLQLWETESAKINTYKADFDRMEYDAVWGPGAGKAFILSTGVLSYSKPDKGSFKIDAIKRWTKTDPQNAAADAPGDYVLQKDEVGEHWVCDGKAVYEYDHRNKQLVVNAIPPEMRGQSIVDGPLPFLFGAEAKKLIDRYWIRAAMSGADAIQLQAFPRRQTDAANYDSVDVILDRPTMQPQAIQVHLPGGQQRHVYAFKDAKVNAKFEALFGGIFSAPRCPLGWQRVNAPQAEAGPQAANPGDAQTR